MRSGYIAVHMHGPDCSEYVHRLVAAAFIGAVPLGAHVLHWDGNPANNRVENLRYGTRSENMMDKVRTGTTNRGERCGASKLTQAQVDEIRRRYGPYVRYGRGRESQRALAAEFGVTWQQIGSIIRGEAWSYDMLA